MVSSVRRTVVVLAAGRGTRLSAVTDRPKALVEVAGLALLDRALALPADEALVVTGHQPDAIASFVSKGSWPHPVRTVHNPNYATEGNARSLVVALSAAKGGDILKLDGDLLVAPDAIDALWRTGGSAALIDRRAPPTEEAMKAQIEQGFVVAWGKGLSRADGESIGAEVIAANDRRRVLAALDAMLADDPMAYYEDAYHRIPHPPCMRAVSMTWPWCEIDTPDDLRTAETLWQAECP